MNYMIFEYFLHPVSSCQVDSRGVDCGQKIDFSFKAKGLISCFGLRFRARSPRSHKAT